MVFLRGSKRRGCANGYHRQGLTTDAWAKYVKAMGQLGVIPSRKIAERRRLCMLDYVSVSAARKQACHCHRSAKHEVKKPRYKRLMKRDFSIPVAGSLQSK